MRSTFVRSLGAGERAQVFLDSQPPAISSAVPATLRAQLDDGVTKLAAFQVEQASADATARGETVNQAALRKDLYTGFMLHVGRVAKAKLKTSPDLPNLVVPSTAQRKLDFVAVANQFADAAAKHVDLLVQNGLPADFMTQLHAAITQVSASAEARDRSLGRLKAAATGAVEAEKEVIIRRPLPS